MAAAGNLTFGRGEIIIRENTPGDCAYIVLKGQVEISKIIDGQRVALDTLGPGAIFGEMSLIDGAPRSATATALIPAMLSVVDKARFQQILNAIPREVRPLFSSLSERLRHTNRLVSVLNQRNRLMYSAYSLLAFMMDSIGERKNGIVYADFDEVVFECCRVLAVDKESVEEVLRALMGTELAQLDESNGKPRILVGELSMLEAFVDFLAEKLSYIPGFPPPTRKYVSLNEKAQQVLFHLRNISSNLEVDRHGNCHYDFDKYVKQATSGLKLGVKDAIITLQNLSVSGHVTLEKFSDVVQNKAIVFRTQDISKAQMLLLQAEEFEQIYRSL